MLGRHLERVDGKCIKPSETLETYFRRIACEMGLEIPYLGVESEEITQYQMKFYELSGLSQMNNRSANN